MPHPSRAHLDALGLPIWIRRGGARAAGRPGDPEAGVGTGAEEALPAQAPQAGTDQVQHHRAQAAPPRTMQGAAVSRSPRNPAYPEPPVSGEASPTGATAGAVACAPCAPAGEERVDSVRIEGSRAQTLETIDAQVRDCRKCALHRTRRQTVFGVGRSGVACMVIGEAPGVEEDARGEPFVGRAGKLLDAMLAAIGLGRDDVYIANIVKCRPPRNRDPHADEISACSGYLERQIEAVSPRLLVASGRVAAQSLLSTTQSIGQLRGRVHRYGDDGDGGLPVLVTYHPAYFLRNPLDKRKAWDDLLRLRAMLAEGAAMQKH